MLCLKSKEYVWYTHRAALNVKWWREGKKQKTWKEQKSESRNNLTFANSLSTVSLQEVVGVTESNQSWWLEHTIDDQWLTFPG